jgi:hypothetical protein
MSGKRLDLRAQARELADEIQIPMTQLTARATVATLPADESIPESGLQPEAAAEPEVAQEEQGMAVERATAVVPPAPRSPVRPRLMKQPVAAPRDRSVEDLISDDRELAPLSVRVPRRVRAELDRQVYTLKAKGKKIKMEDVVTAALVLFLNIDDE